MEITEAVMRRAVRQECFGTLHPFASCDEHAIDGFYKDVLAAIQRTNVIALQREPEHHGSGYASYISAFLYPRDGSTSVDMGEFVETKGILLYLCRLAPIAVFGASSRGQNKHNSGSSSGFVTVENLNVSPDGDWSRFMQTLATTLEAKGVEVLPRELLIAPAPADIQIPTVFDPPYYVFDTLFYWED